MFVLTHARLEEVFHFYSGYSFTNEIWLLNFPTLSVQQTEAFLLLHQTTNGMQILIDMRKCYIYGTSLKDDWICASVLWLSYWLSKRSWILLIYNRKNTALNAQTHGKSQLPGFKFMDIKRQQRHLHVWNKQVQRQRETGSEKTWERRRKRKRARMNIVFSAVPSDIRLSGFKHQHIKFRGVSRSCCEIQSVSSFVLSQSHTFPLFLVCVNSHRRIGFLDYMIGSISLICNHCMECLKRHKLEV